MKHAFCCCVIVFLLFSLHSTAFAVTLSFVDTPQEISDEFSVKLIVSGAKPATNYFKILLFEEGNRAMLSQTWNGSSWYDGPDGNQYFPSPVSGSESTIELRGKLKENTKEGEYVLSVRRYTASGNSASGDSISPVRVRVRGQITTATQTATPTLSPATPSPAERHTTVPVVQKTATPEVEIPESTPEVLGLISQETKTLEPRISASPSPTLEPTDTFTQPVGFGLGTVGLGFVAVGGGMFWRKYNRWYTNRA